MIWSMHARLVGCARLWLSAVAMLMSADPVSQDAKNVLCFVVWAHAMLSSDLLEYIPESVEVLLGSDIGLLDYLTEL